MFNETYASGGQIRTVTANVNVHHFTFTGAGDLEGCHDDAKSLYNAHDLIVGISEVTPDGEPHQSHFVSINAFTGECFGDTYECRYQASSPTPAKCAMP